MKRILFVIAALAAMLMFACKQESNANTTTSGTETSATAPTGTETTGTMSTGTETTETTATGTSTTGTAPMTVNKTDEAFMVKAAGDNQEEVDLGQLAAAKATDNDVKAFGDRMVADHGKANDALKQIAANKGVTLPTTPSANDKKTSNELSKETAKAFDKAYMSNMVKDHEADVAAFKKEQKEVKDPDLKNWIDQTLPIIEDHLKSAKQIHAKLK